VLRREANNRVRLTSGAAEFNIVGQPARTIRPSPRRESQLRAVDPAGLLEMIEKTQFAISATRRAQPQRRLLRDWRRQRPDGGHDGTASASSSGRSKDNST